MTGEALTRRSFIEVAGSVVLLNGAAGQPQLEDPGHDPTDVEAYGLVVEPRRPPTAALDAEWDTYRIVQLNPTTGAKHYTTHELSGWREIPMPNPTTQIDEVRVEDYTSFFNHHFARPEAPDTKNWDFTDADVSKVESEIELASTTAMASNQRGNYPPGTESIPGVAFRLTGTPSGGRGDAGYFTASDGFGAGADGTDDYVFLRKGGSEHRVYRRDWNGYVPDTRPFVNGEPRIVRFKHLFYGGGKIQCRGLFHEGTDTDLRTMHTFTPANTPERWDAGPPFDQPNLAIQFETSSLAGGALRANAAHYEFGETDAETRINGEHITGKSVDTSGWTPLISWRKRSGWDMVNVKPLKVALAAESADVKLELQLDPGLGSPSWSRATHSSSSETAVEVDTSGTLDSNGERRWPGYVTAGQLNEGSIIQNDVDFNLPTGQAVTLAAQGVGGTATVSGVLAWEEFF